MRRPKFAVGEYYHIYNRGVDKRMIFLEKSDTERFLESIQVFNSREPVGSLYEERRKRKRGKFGGRTSTNEKSERLIKLICYCLNPNHYHVLIQEVHDGGISEFIKRLSGGYTMYFNEKYSRSGVLFQGKFKAVHIKTNENLLKLSVYINLNYILHNIPNNSSLIASSVKEYYNTSAPSICEKKILLSQFSSIDEYKKFSNDCLKVLKKRKTEERELEMLVFNQIEHA